MQWGGEIKIQRCRGIGGKGMGRKRGDRAVTQVGCNRGTYVLEWEAGALPSATLRPGLAVCAAGTTWRTVS